VRSFHSDDALRVTWDDNIAEFALLSKHGAREVTELQFWRSKFPRPFASREYVFAKQHWTDEVEKACFSVSKGVDVLALELNGDAVAPPTGYRVQDYFVATKISDVTRAGDTLPVAQLVQYSQEVNGVSAAMINLTLKRGLWGFVQTQHHALCSYLDTTQGVATRALPPPRSSSARQAAAAAAAGSPSRWGGGGGAPRASGSPALRVAPPLLASLNQPHVQELLRRMQSSSRSLLCGARRAITSHVEEQRDDMLPGVRWAAMLVMGTVQRGNRFLRRVGPDGQRVRKRDVVRSWMHRELGNLHDEKERCQERMYGVWQRIHLSEPHPVDRSAGGAAQRGGPPARWWQGLLQRRNCRVDAAKLKAALIMDGLRQRRNQLRRHACLVLMPLAFVLKAKAPMRDAAFT
jgi:hypothetical protein